MKGNATMRTNRTRRATLLATLLAAALLSACAATTLLDKEVIAMRSVTAARQVSSAALRAERISLDEDRRAQADLTLLANGIRAAVAAQDAQAVAANQRKAEAIRSELEKK